MQMEEATMRRLRATAPQAAATSHGVAIQASGLGLRSPRITAYQGVDLDLAAGEAHAILAEHKAGKTELLLTLSGRMLATSGELTVDGINARNIKGLHQIRSFSGLGWFENVNELERVLKLRTCVSAELGLMGKRSNRVATEAYLDKWGLSELADRDLESLDRIDYVRLGIALGMAGDPRLLLIDDIERDLTERQSLALAHELCDLAHDCGVTVVCGVCDYDIARVFDTLNCISDDARAQVEIARSQAERAGRDDAAGRSRRSRRDAAPGKTERVASAAADKTQRQASVASQQGMVR
jgi:ABC-type branched-subunit amino acid transport system ATPase component